MSHPLHPIGVDGRSQRLKDPEAYLGEAAQAELKEVWAELAMLGQDGKEERHVKTVKAIRPFPRDAGPRTFSSRVKSLAHQNKGGNMGVGCDSHGPAGVKVTPARFQTSWEPEVAKVGCRALSLPPVTVATAPVPSPA